MPGPGPGPPAPAEAGGGEPSSSQAVAGHALPGFAAAIPGMGEMQRILAGNLPAEKMEALQAMAQQMATQHIASLHGMLQPAPPPPPQAEPATSAPSLPDPDTAASMEMYNATMQAQRAQYLQQYQFHQQLRLQQTQIAAGGSSNSRFKESFRPMRLCKHLLTVGTCKQSRQCTFAHTFDELHPASPDLPQDYSAETTALAEDTALPSDSVPDMRLKKKKEMCGRFSRGECSLGRICPFAHTEEELGKVGLAVCGKVKTRLCVFWDPVTKMARGCIYGKNCNNAHGDWEIGLKRPPPELAPPMKKWNKFAESVIQDES